MPYGDVVSGRGHGPSWSRLGRIVDRGGDLAELLAREDLQGWNMRDRI